MQFGSPHLLILSKDRAIANSKAKRKRSLAGRSKYSIATQRLCQLLAKGQFLCLNNKEKIYDFMLNS